MAILKEKDQLEGTVRLILQPAERNLRKVLLMFWQQDCWRMFKELLVSAFLS